MPRFVSLLVFLFAMIGGAHVAHAESPGTYSATATAKVDGPGTITVSSNGGAIDNVVVKLNGVLLVEGVGYTKTIDGSRVTVNFIVAVAKDDVADISGQCATSGTHEGELHDSSNWDQ
jgi:hypothetical protein